MCKRHLAILFLFSVFVMAAGVFSAAGDASNVVSDDNNNAVIASIQPVANVTETASPPCALTVQMYQSADLHTAFTKTNFGRTNLAGGGGLMTDVIKDKSASEELNSKAEKQNRQIAAQVRSRIKENPPGMQAKYYKSSNTQNNTELTGLGPKNESPTTTLKEDQTKKMKVNVQFQIRA